MTALSIVVILPSMNQMILVDRIDNMLYIALFVVVVVVVIVAVGMLFNHIEDVKIAKYRSTIGYGASNQYSKWDK